MRALSRLTTAILLAGCLLAGCAQHPAVRPAHPATATIPHSAAGLPEHTGIAVCDDYLSSYLACHRTAAIFPPEQLQSRYEAMRTSLLRDSQNPTVRPQLAARCISLTRQLHDVLHGKSCGMNPASASSTP